MARTAETVRRLVDEDPSMAEALVTLLERDGEVVQWADVSDDLTTGQWGRLIETGLLEDAEDGFRIADPEQVRAVVLDDGSEEAAAGSETGGEDDGPPGDAGWSTWDKVAGLVALSLFPGYYLTSIRNAVATPVDAILGPIDAALPFYLVILVMAVLTGLYSTIMQANLMDMDRMSYYQQQMKDLRERQQEAKERGDDEELERLREQQMEQMGENLGMFKEQFRPMVWIMILIIPVFLWMYWKIGRGGASHLSAVETEIVVPLAGAVPLNGSMAGPFPTWIVWYFLCSLAFSQIIRKALNVQTTPT